MVTVVLYLSDASEGLVGGETLLPCVDAAEATGGRDRDGARYGTAPVGVAELCRRMRVAYAADQMFLSPVDGIHQDAAFDADAAWAASSLCEGHAQPAGVLRVAPRRGGALLFTSASPDDGAELPLRWHGGCRVDAGAKWTMQAFREVPPGHGGGAWLASRARQQHNSLAGFRMM